MLVSLVNFYLGPLVSLINTIFQFFDNHASFAKRKFVQHANVKKTND